MSKGNAVEKFFSIIFGLNDESSARISKIFNFFQLSKKIDFSGFLQIVEIEDKVRKG